MKKVDRNPVDFLKSLKYNKKMYIKLDLFFAYFKIPKERFFAVFGSGTPENLKSMKLLINRFKGCK